MTTPNPNALCARPDCGRAYSQHSIFSRACPCYTSFGDFMGWSSDTFQPATQGGDGNDCLTTAQGGGQTCHRAEESSAQPKSDPLVVGDADPTPGAATPEEATGYRVTQCEDRTHHTFSTPEKVCVDCYPDGSAAIVVRNGGKDVIIEIADNEALRSDLATERAARVAAQAECAKLREEISKFQDDLKRIANAIGIESPLELIAAAENDEETYIDILIRLVGKSMRGEKGAE